MKKIGIVLMTLFAALAALVGVHFSLIEIGREVVVLRTESSDGTPRETRLWVVDVDGVPWLHSAGPVWTARMSGRPEVELKRGDQWHRYVAVARPGEHPQVDRALRDKYGVADRWVRFIAPCGEDTLAVRLEPVMR